LQYHAHKPDHREENNWKHLTPLQKATFDHLEMLHAPPKERVRLPLASARNIVIHIDYIYELALPLFVFLIIFLYLLKD
jgi:hypothetical protein